MILVYSQHPGMGWITLRRCCRSLPQPQEGAPRGHLSQPPTRSRTMPAESQHQPDARVAAGHTPQPPCQQPPTGHTAFIPTLQPGVQQYPALSAAAMWERCGKWCQSAPCTPTHGPPWPQGQATLQPLQEEIGPLQHSIFDKSASTIPNFLSCLSRVWKQTPGQPP